MKKKLILFLERYILTKLLLVLIHTYRESEQREYFDFIRFGFWYTFYISKAYSIRLLNKIREVYSIQLLRRSVLINTSKLKKYTVFINLPLNVSSPFLKRQFRSKAFYYMKPLKVKVIHNVFLDIGVYSGVVFKNGKIVKDSIHKLWNYRMYWLIKQAYIDAFRRYIIYKGKSQLKKDEDSHYLLIHDWFNYYHWMTESLERLWEVKNSIQDYTLLLPSQFEAIDFVQETLKAFNVKKIVYLDKPCFIEELTLVENIPYCDNYYVESLKGIANHLINYAKTQVDFTKYNLGEFIFISRQHTKVRRIDNHTEVQEVLRELGFTEIAFEDYSLVEQIAIMSHIKKIGSMHGAGLTNIMFMPEGGSVLELHRIIKRKSDHHNIAYMRLASIFNHKYFWQEVIPTDAEENFFYTQSVAVNYHVDTDRLKNNLREL